jgi:branched-chain amino acid transport system ATP-binding protein
MLRVRGLTAGYGGALVLHGLDFDIAAGEVLVLLGRNGAGKSTTLKALIGLIRPRAGKIVFAGADIAGRAPCDIARRGLGYVPEERRIFTELTVAENLETGRQPPRAGRERWSEARVFALFPALAGLRGRKGGQLSGGEQQMLAIGRTLMGNPDLILLDEPSEGLAPVILAQLATALRALKQEGVAMLLAEQNVALATAVGDRALAIETGRMVWRGGMAEFTQDVALRERLLGLEGSPRRAAGLSPKA